jgi:hypothetical protein
VAIWFIYFTIVVAFIRFDVLVVECSTSLEFLACVACMTREASLVRARKGAMSVRYAFVSLPLEFSSFVNFLEHTSMDLLPQVPPVGEHSMKKIS